MRAEVSVSSLTTPKELTEPATQEGINNMLNEWRDKTRLRWWWASCDMLQSLALKKHWYALDKGITCDPISVLDNGFGCYMKIPSKIGNKSRQEKVVVWMRLAASGMKHIWRYWTCAINRTWRAATQEGLWQGPAKGHLERSSWHRFHGGWGWVGLMMSLGH